MVLCTFQGMVTEVFPSWTQLKRVLRSDPGLSSVPCDASQSYQRGCSIAAERLCRNVFGLTTGRAPIVLNEYAAVVQCLSALPRETRFIAYHGDNYDYTDDIQDAIDWASDKQGIVKIPSGRFLISRPIKMRSHVTLRGSGALTILSPTLANGAPFHGKGFIQMVDVTGGIVEDFVIDEQGYLRKNTPTGNFIWPTMVFRNANSNIVQRIKFLNHGSPSYLDQTGKPVGGAGENIIMYAENKGVEWAGGFELLPRSSVPGGGSIYDNVIRNCTFDTDPDPIHPDGKPTYADMAIRLLTDFPGSPKIVTNPANRDPTSGFLNMVFDNRIEDSSFHGNYDWNTVELAGRATYENLILNNVFDGKTLSHIDFDKGASGSVARWNRIISSGKASWHIGRPNTRASAISVHGNYICVGPDGNLCGSPAPAGARQFTTQARRNQILDNIIENFDSGVYSDALESAIYLEKACGTVVAGNTVNAVNKATAGFSLGVFLENQVFDSTLEGNEIHGVDIGILTDPADGTWINNLMVNNNHIDARRSAMLIETSIQIPVGWRVTNNVFNVLEKTRDAVFLDMDYATISHNLVSGGFNGFVLEADKTFLSQNSSANAAAFGYKYWQQGVSIPMANTATGYGQGALQLTTNRSPKEDTRSRVALANASLPSKCPAYDQEVHNNPWLSPVPLPGPTP